MDDLQHAAGTASPNPLFGVPEYILNTFFPGVLPLLARSPRVAKLISLLVAVWWVGPSAVWRLKHFLDNVSSLIVSSVTVSSDEDLFEYLVRWLATKRTVRQEHALVASLGNPSPHRKRNSYYQNAGDEISPHEDIRNVEIQYESSHGLQWLLHQRRLFFLRRDFGEGSVYNGGKSHRMETLTLGCLGRSAQPVKDLLEDIYREHRDKEKALTIIRRPYGAHYGRSGWSRISQKPRRDVDTVILEATLKAEIMSDIETYIDPSTQAWYGARGIPYRRGYLFHGEPGTGKTSLAMAIAGRFGLNIYVISLLDMSIGDSELIGLFNTLPPKCLLLLEDIDTVGLQRESSASQRPSWARVSARLANGNDDDDDDDDEKPQRSRVSLSGLLNAIDGVAAPEGHILIMTTNKPDKLDEALVRSGRISVRVGFGMATAEQACDIFMRMYWHKEEKEEEEAEEEEKEEALESDSSEKGAPSPSAEYTRLAGLARQFGALVPDHVFSPADLQDFLLMRRKDAQRAIDEVEAWAATMMQERARKAEGEAKRRNDKLERVKLQMAEVMALSETQGARRRGVYPESSPKLADEVEGDAQESTATTTTTPADGTA